MSGTATPIAVTGSSGDVWSDAIIYGSRWDGPGATTTVSVDIAGIGGAETVDENGNTALEPTAAELAYIRASMAGFEAVCEIDFVEVGSQGQADLVWAIVDDEDGQGALGYATLPQAGAGPGFQGSININRDAFNDGPDALAVGGFDFATPIHELGHAVGLDHSHDQPTPFPGLSDPGDLGNFDMNQGIFTMMGYNDGWRTAPMGVSPSPYYGYQAGPMAIDIAALQSLYGANTSYRTGADTYALPGADGVGTTYSCIWDAGGTDRMLGTARADSIDLRAATLLEAPGGGGTVSFAAGIHGGYTIAGGVLIENARGGEGADAVRGNAGANALGGQGGDDRLDGAEGADELWGNAGDDALTGGAGADRLHGDAGADDFVYARGTDSLGAGRDTVLGFQRGADDVAVGAIDADAGVSGNQAFTLDAGGAWAAGEIRQTVKGGDLLLEFNTDGDGAAEMAILLTGVTSPLAAGDFIL